ncbi:MAG: hypothetical protein H7831_15930 [Magnetococcus sp. WYHC-3]
MDKAQLLQAVEKSIAEARAWADSGWPMTFGGRGEAVNSLGEAEAKSERFVYRQEAINYWRDVQEMGEECAASAEKAKAALESGSPQRAADQLYFASFVEKRTNMVGRSPLFDPLWKAAQALVR